MHSHAGAWERCTRCGSGHRAANDRMLLLFAAGWPLLRDVDITGCVYKDERLMAALQLCYLSALFSRLV